MGIWSIARLSLIVVAASLVACGRGGLSASVGVGFPGGQTVAEQPPAPGVGEAGTVRHVDLEGGFYAIIGDSGQKYDPVNLPKEFMQDGLRVRFQGRIVKDAVSYRMYGTVVEIVSIEKQ